MIFCVSLTLQSCKAVDDYNKAAPAINKELDNIELLTKKLEDSYKEHLEGTLTTEQLGDLTVQIRDSIKSSRDAIVKIKDDSVGWGGVVMASIIALISRGIPSKGPLAMLFGLFTARRKD